jgi:Flp pilus assembly protein TadB
MARFAKTRIHWYTAGLFLLGLYALAGLVYAAIAHSTESMAIWATVAVIAFVGSFVFQAYIRRKHRGQERQGPQ